jgi:uncharacterized membrane protein YfhO
MSLSRQFNKQKYTALAFLIPAVSIILVMLVSQYAPFGKYSVLYSDMYHQYYPFFVSYRRALLSGESLLYAWDVGMGMDYLGLLSYYLGSPLNLLSVLVPESWLLSFFSLLIPIKLGFAGMFFSIFLKKIFKKNDISISVFSALYALCAWALGYQWNIMWLDTFALLPLVVLGTISLLKSRKFVLYTVTLFLSVLSNYYIGLFTCIFVFLVFVCYEICRWQGFHKFFADLCRIAVFSALAIGMTAVLSLPTLAALQTTQSSINKFPHGFRLNIADKNTWLGLLDAMRQVAGNMNGGIVPTFKEGLPNLYCGIGTNIFAVLFLTSKQVRRRDKVCSVLMLTFLNLSFIVRQLDYIWHGFHFTNMIPYRFSFLYSFVMLYMAYKAYVLRFRFELWQIITACIAAIGICLCSESLSDPIYLTYNGLFLILHIAALIFMQRFTHANEADEEQNRISTRKVSSWVLLGVMALEIIMCTINFGLNFSGTNVSNYPKGKKDTATVIQYMKQYEDSLFYRAETTHSQTLNDGALNNYNGISAFTSSANVRVTAFMKALGYGAKNTYNRYCFEESSPVSNLFLDLKYMIERDDHVEENPYFTDICSTGNVHLLENNAHLPLGFLANSQIINVDFTSDGNRFLFQNKLLKETSGVYENVWNMLDSRCLTIFSSHETVSGETSTGSCTYDATQISEKTTVTYSYSIESEGFMCIYLDLSKKNSYNVYRNGEKLFNETYSIPQMMAISQVAPGDVIEIELNCKANETGNINISAALMNDDVFQKAYAVLSKSTLQLTSFSNTKLAGTINCNRSGVLYTSIPQNGNWSAKVDGKPADIILIGDAMIGLLLSEGEHEITFTYRNPAFELGWRLSLVCLLIFLFLYYVSYRPTFKRKKGMYEK